MIGLETQGILDRVCDLGLDEIAAACDLGTALANGSLAVHLHKLVLVELGLLEDLHLADEDVLRKSNKIAIRIGRPK